jgi:molybdenum cofactor cytidylyltransferase
MTVNSKPRIGGLLLAAGGSTRFGRSKQLAEFKGKTLLRRAAETLAGSACAPVVVVLGGNFEAAQTEIDDLELKVCINPEWQTGMSSSIRAGLRALSDIDGSLDGVIVALSDQPFIDKENIDSLIAEFQKTTIKMVAAEYDGVVGVPALFSRDMFDDLVRLQGDAGARYLLRNSADVGSVKMQSAAFDVDRPDDLMKVTDSDGRVVKNL